MTILEQLEDADKTLAADGYKEDSHVRLAISEAIRALCQPPVSCELPYLEELRAKVEYLECTELLRIAEQAEAKEACEPQLNKFKQFIEQGDYLQAWQTVLGNIEWLKAENIELPSDLESLANNVGKIWHDNGRLYIEKTYKDGKLHGLYRRYGYDGELLDVAYYVNGNIVQH